MAMPTEQLQRLASDTVEQLTGTGALAEAASVAEHYLRDADNAVLLLTRAREWREALRVAYQ